ncbi:MAG: hypothetical protein ACI7YS_06380 [Flavobacterium sp.]
MKLISLFQKIDIAEKIKNAPTKEYEVGVLIGSFIPFVVFAIIAYYLYYRMKNRMKNID